MNKPRFSDYTASEVITQLKELMEEYGDLPVSYTDGQLVQCFIDEIDVYDEDGNEPGDKPPAQFTCI